MMDKKHPKHDVHDEIEFLWLKNKPFGEKEVKLNMMRGNTNIDVHYDPFCLDFCFLYLEPKAPPAGR